MSELAIEKDVAIALRDGATIRADVFRPRADGRFPVLISLGPYQKDKPWVPPADLEEAATPNMNWETATPEWWVPRGYALVRVDTRGTGRSPGWADMLSSQEAQDFYDAIEWAGAQRWSNGNVGAIGVSYLAMTQWQVASLQPPSLKAIVPWEGAADMYRDAFFHGGIFSLGFWGNWYNTHMAHHLLGRPNAANPDAFRENWLWNLMRHGLDSVWWDARRPDWSRVTVPVFSAGNWSGMGLHLRGNTEGFLRAASTNKKLRVHTGTHFHPFYSEDGKCDQLRFLDHWLKGVDTGVVREPQVKLLIRAGGGRPAEWRHENEWPIARTQWTRFHLVAEQRHPGGPVDVEGTLQPEPPSVASAVTYSASGMAKQGVNSASASAMSMLGPDRLGVSFVSAPFTEDVEVTGPVALVLWVSSSTDDMDLFVTVRNLDPDGNDVFETGQQGQPVPVAKGWLRASHRRLDPKLSLPYRPHHLHRAREPLVPGTPTRVDVEIWPTSMIFARGHRLRLDIQPRDGIGSAPYLHYHADYNTGTNTIHTGPEHPSHLLLPIVPRRR